MTWSRGFFRIWIAVSLFYIAIAGLIIVMGNERLRPLFVAPKYDIQLPGGTVRTFDTAQTRDSLDSSARFAYYADIDALKKAGRTAQASEIQANFGGYVDALVKSVQDFRAKARDDAFQALTITLAALFLPPLILLLIGIVVCWIARGFRHA